MKYKNKIIVICFDTLMIPIAWLSAYWLRFNLSYVPASPLHAAISTLPIIMCTQLACYLFYKQHRGIWHFASVPDLMRIIKAVLTASLVSFAIIYPYHHLAGIPRSVFPLYAMILTGLLTGSRLLYRSFKESKQYRNKVSNKKNVLIIGAGQAGEMLARELKRDSNSEYHPVAFLDDTPRYQRTEIHGIPVVDTIHNAPKVIKKLNVDLVTIAIPSATSEQMRHIVEKLSQTPVPFQTLPNLSALASGQVSLQDLREVSLEDLLGRDAVSLDRHAIQSTLMNKRVLITGGGGSIGSELCRQILSFNPESILILEHSEFNLYEIEHELKIQHPEKNIHIALASVTDEQALKQIFTNYKPQLVFHAAAYKHVPMLQSQIRCAVKNNIIGTRLIADMAVDFQAEKFILVSTDKAVNPTNIMGATKRAAEIYCQNLNARTNTQFVTVRFGNVLGSAGSVIPLFKKQLKAGGPITVTHPDITRYFMLIPEACQLILQSSVLGTGGEIFVLDMGDPIKITFLAEQLIRLSGKVVNKDIHIKFTGLRPGEKLFEELFHAKEALAKTPHEKILMSIHRTVNWEQLSSQMDQFTNGIITNNEVLLADTLQALVPEMTIAQAEKVTEKV